MVHPTMAFPFLVMPQHPFRPKVAPTDTEAQFFASQRWMALNGPANSLTGTTFGPIARVDSLGQVASAPKGN